MTNDPINDVGGDRPATKNDILALRLELRDREIKSIRWFIATFLGAQIAYFAITLGAVYFLLQHLHGSAS